MFLLYSLIIRIYGTLVSIASFIYPKAKFWKQGRKYQLDKIKPILAQWKDDPRVMIHSASYGEFEMAKPIIEILKEDPDTKFIISFFSPSGYQNTHFYDDRFLKIYLPLDTTRNQKKLLDLLKPSAVLFIKYDFWFNLLRELELRKTPYYFTSLHLNASSYLLKSFMHPFAELLRASRMIYCHNKGSEKILAKNDFQNLKVLGDTRIPQVIKNSQTNKGELDWPNNNTTTIGLGSLIPSEYGILREIIRQFPDANLMIAPHDIGEKDIKELIQNIGEPIHKYSEGKTSEERIVIIDTLGDLKYLYRVCDVAYVGAGFEKGPHNVLEPLIYNIPTCTGNNIMKFPMAQHLRDLDILTVIDRPSLVSSTMEEMLKKNKTKFKNKTVEFFDNHENNLLTLTDELKSNF